MTNSGFRSATIALSLIGHRIRRLRAKCLPVDLGYKSRSATIKRTLKHVVLYSTRDDTSVDCDKDGAK
jgi:hypothetical protein